MFFFLTRASVFRHKIKKGKAFCLSKMIPNAIINKGVAKNRKRFSLERKGDHILLPNNFSFRV